ncbi:MAG: uroporphyrinogen III synthase [Alphaproteobacteria bacterium]|nr:MAG: uroporphyrinogen III synthase [Alphaproteobacteria bacterium]
MLTRPEEDSRNLARKLLALGHGVQAEPLLQIDFLPQDEIDLANFQALAFTSANGVRAFVRIYQNRDIPCFAVGEATAGEAEEAGFQSIYTAGGNVVELAELMTRSLNMMSGPILHISGQDIAGDLSGRLSAAGFQLIRAPLYKAEKSTAMTAAARKLITSGQISHIPFYSPRSAKIFMDLIRLSHMENHLTEITAICLSSAVSDMISSYSWQKILTAKHPNQSSLFNLVGVKLEENRQ